MKKMYSIYSIVAYVHSEGSLDCHTFAVTRDISVYYGHILGPMIFIPVAERLEVDLPLPVFTTCIYVAAGIRTSNLSHARRTYNTTAPSQQQT